MTHETVKDEQNQVTPCILRDRRGSPNYKSTICTILYKITTNQVKTDGNFKNLIILNVIQVPD